MEVNEKQIEITENYIDLEKLLASKKVKLPRFVVRFLKRLLHIDEINEGIYKYRDRKGVDFATAILEYLDIKMVMVHPERIPTDGYPIVAGNHPLGGADGMALISAVGERRGDIKFPVNDFLMALPGLAPVFIPVDKVHRNTTTVAGIEAAFADKNCLLYFPAGLCSRKTNGKVMDPRWKSTFIKKAVKYQRDVVPVFFDAVNRKRFYTIANLRKRLGIKFNFEMALLPSELFAQRGKTFRVIYGKPIPYSVFDSRHSAQEWADRVHDFVYTLKDNPDAEFDK